jgi:hypothetical protein
MSEHITQAAYAAHRGVAKSYITKLKQEGRLVLNAAGLVDVAASDARIDQTAEPARDDVAARHQQARGAAPTTLDPVGNGYQAARAVKERFLALEAKRSYEEAMGQLRDGREVEALVAGAMTELRQRLENLTDTLAPELAAMSDEARVRAHLRDEITHALESAAHHFSRLASQAKQQP